MGISGSFAHHPQSGRLRRALFQVHLWTGIGLGIYIFLISLSGSVMVFRRELDKALCPQTILVPPSGPRLSDRQLTAIVRAQYSRFRFAQVSIRGPRVPGAAVEIWLTRGAARLERLFDPYTGRNLGDTVAREPAVITWIADFHDNLLGGDTGQLVNGAAAILVTLICMTGAIIWWPGTGRWRRSLTLHRTSNWHRLIWDLHSMLGFWMLLFIAMWAVTGIYFGFPDVFNAAIDSFRVSGANQRAFARGIDTLIAWLVRLHFGRSFGASVQVLWAVLGLVPCTMFVTGALMWWNRVLHKSMHRAGEPRAAR